MKELEEEVAGIAMMMGKEPKLVAEEFLKAYNKAETNKDKPEYKEIANIQEKAMRFWKNEHELDKESK
jgi:hypothetical protein